MQLIVCNSTALGMSVHWVFRRQSNRDGMAGAILTQIVVRKMSSIFNLEDLEILKFALSLYFCV